VVRPNYDADREYQLVMRELFLLTVALTLALVVGMIYLAP
jgi:hypothetical protein